MRIWVNCKLCAELVFFDIEEVTNLSEMCPVSELMEERFGPIDPKLLYDTAKEIPMKHGLKEIRFSKNCPKCGALITSINWMPLS